MFVVRYAPDVLEVDLARLDRAVRDRIRKAIEQRLFTRPQDYGKPLRATLAGLWSLRVGDYRIIYRIVGNEVHVLRIGHRREAYQDL